MRKLSRPLRLLIIQPYLPAYRVPFFDQLVPRLAADGIDCRVAIPGSPLTQADRGDDSDAPWTIRGKGRNVRLAGRSFPMYGSAPARRGADAVITGLASTSIDTWAAVFSTARRRIPLGLWGHVGNYVSPPSRVDQRLKMYQARRADHIFAYTPAGATTAQRWGVPADRITCVMNTVDTQPLLDAALRLTDEAVASFRDAHGLTTGHTSAFIGALDTSKRIAFLAEVLEHIWRLDPSFKLLLGGRGEDRPLLDPARSRRQIVDMGFATADHKAMMAACASTLCMPGRIGLVAIDALVLGLPVVTTDWPYHAPEADYLREGSSRFSSHDNPRAFADLLLRRTAAEYDRSAATVPSMTAMVDRFAAGVMCLVDPVLRDDPSSRHETPPRPREPHRVADTNAPVHESRVHR